MICASVYRLPVRAIVPPCLKAIGGWSLTLHQLSGARHLKARLTDDAVRREAKRIAGSQA